MNRSNKKKQEVERGLTTESEVDRMVDYGNSGERLFGSDGESVEFS